MSVHFGTYIAYHLHAMDFQREYITVTDLEGKKKITAVKIAGTSIDFSFTYDFSSILQQL